MKKITTLLIMGICVLNLKNIETKKGTVISNNDNSIFIEFENNEGYYLEKYYAPINEKCTVTMYKNLIFKIKFDN